MECLSCHHQPKSTCADCHESQTKFIRGEALGEKDPQPDVMAGAIKCNECHATISRGHSLAEIKKTCVQCHEPKYEKMTDDWQKEVSGRVKKLKLSLDSLKDLKREISDPEKKKVEVLTREVENLLKVVEGDKSRGVHNFAYAQKLLSDAEGKVYSTGKTLSKRIE
jgi:hypothetical protein